MIAYLDASVVLRILLREEQPLAEWDQIDVAITSELTRVEIARTIDRLTVLQVLQDDEIDEKYAEAADLVRRIDFMHVDPKILVRASKPLPTVLGTLDSIHLASAMTYRDAYGSDESEIVLATHDRALATAGRMLQFRVLGA